MPLSTAGGVNVYGSFPATTPWEFATGLTYWLQQAGWHLSAQLPGTVSGSITFGGGLTIGGIRYDFVDVLDNSVAHQVLKGADLLTVITNLVAAINGSAGAGTQYSAVTLPNALLAATSSTSSTLTVSSRVLGPGGSGITTAFGRTSGGGYMLLGTSPQVRADTGLPLSVNLFVGDTLSGSLGSDWAASMQMISTDDTAVASGMRQMTVALNSGSPYSSRFPGVYRVIANRCQFFVYQPGVDELGGHGSICCGGIPCFAPTASCSDEHPSLPVSELWWFAGDQGLSPSATPRIAFGSGIRFTRPRLNLPIGSRSGEACYDGQLCSNGIGGSGIGLPIFCMLTGAEQVDNQWSGSGVISQALWVGDVPMLLEPVIAWGDDSSQTPRIRGQLWDAWIRTQQDTMDATYTFSGSNWVGFTDRFLFGTLALAVPSLTPAEFTAPEQNYAF